jgi:large subunit ribosomal protein L10
MKKLGLLFKEVSENRIKSFLKESSAFFVIKYSGISSPDLSGLRLSLRGSGAQLFVVKNSVARRALKSTGIDALIKSIEGPCGLVFAKDEPVGASKVLCTFLKDHEQLKLEGGFLQDKVLGKVDIEAMAKLPSKELLRAEVVGTLNGPIVGFVMTLNQLLARFVYTLEEVKKKKPN